MWAHNLQPFSGVKVLLVSIFNPSPENSGGPTQLVHDLGRYAPDGIEVDMLLYSNERPVVPADLFNKVYFERPLKVSGVSGLWSPRLTKKMYPVPEHIDFEDYDVVWLYQEWLYPDFKAVHRKVVVSGMDSSVLLYSRALKRNTWHKTFNTCSKWLRAYLLESSVGAGHCIHVVGQADAECIRRVNAKSSCFYSEHPLINCRVQSRGERHPRPVIGVTGRYSSFIFGRFFDAFLREYAASTDPSGQSWVFLGSGWEAVVRKFAQAGIDAKHIRVVDDYDAFISELDVHFVPILVGAGTKGKVLHSVASGVLTIGSKIAYENILDTDSPFVFRSAAAAVYKLNHALADVEALASGRAELQERTLSKFKSEYSVPVFWSHVRVYLDGDSRET